MSKLEESYPLFADDAEHDDENLTPDPTPLVQEPDLVELALLPPPPYSPTQQLEATTPGQSSRYDKQPLSLDDYPVHVDIPAGLFCVTAAHIAAVPEGWLEFVHPEGQNYFYHPGRRICTEANLRIFDYFQRINQAAGKIDALISHLGLELPTSTELLLELGDDNPDGATCRYYLVDHIRRTIFWLEHTNSESLDLPPVSSMIHRKILLQQHYWSHVELFPMHVALPVSVEEELIAILSHTCIDLMTSDLSTVPYSQDQCEAFIKIITRTPDSQGIDGYRNSVMARLWCEIAGNYSVNLHGESSAPLSRNQRPLHLPEVEPIGFINKVLLHIPERYQETLSGIWVDNIAYHSHWQAYMASCLKEWRRLSVWAMILLIASFGVFGISMSLRTVPSFYLLTIQSASLLSTFFSLISVTSSLTMAHNFKHHRDVHASEAVDFIESACHPTFGLQPLAVMFGLPYASLIYGFMWFGICVLLLSFTSELFAFGRVIWIAIPIGLAVGCPILAAEARFPGTDISSSPNGFKIARQGSKPPQLTQPSTTFLRDMKLLSNLKRSTLGCVALRFTNHEAIASRAECILR